MGGPGFVLSRYFNKFACKVGYLMVTRKVIALICLSRVYFSPLKCYQRYHKSILWLTKAHQLLLVGLLTHITLRPGLFSFNFFFWDLFIGDLSVQKKKITFKVTTFEIKKDQWACLACLSVLVRLTKGFKSIEKTIWDTSGVCGYIRS